jgi:hypothetical protein
MATKNTKSRKGLSLLTTKGTKNTKEVVVTLVFVFFVFLVAIRNLRASQILMVSSTDLHGWQFNSKQASADPCRSVSSVVFRPMFHLLAIVTIGRARPNVLTEKGGEKLRSACGGARGENLDGGEESRAES